MGSKMAAASRVVQVVKPHMPLIRFPDRMASPRPSVQEALKSVQLQTPAQSPSAVTHASQQSGTRSAEVIPPSLQNTAFASRTSGVADTADIVRALPPKYRRKPLEKDEIEYIQRGGPE